MAHGLCRRTTLCGSFPCSPTVMAFICNHEVIRQLLFQLNLPLSKSLSPSQFLFYAIPQLSWNSRNLLQNSVLNSAVALYGRCSCSYGFLWGLSGWTPSAVVQQFLPLTEHIAGVHGYAIWQGTRNALILEAFCFQEKPWHFPWGADTFYGEFHFAVNSASNKQ